MGLQEEIDKARGEIKTDAYPMSIGEWINLYKDGELDIHPEFQRFFRWKNNQKSRFIESILLGIPIPPIFVAQTEKGIWDVVDGLQRLSTIFEFMGILKDENGNICEPLILEGTKYLPSLKGRYWDNPEDEENSFTSPQRLFIKRSKLDVSIILRESYEMVKYELFQRLNTGGTPLSEQEVRNCIIVMFDKQFYVWLKSLGQNDIFQECISISENALSEQYDLELILRFLLFRKIDEVELTKITDIGEFLTDKMVEVLKAKQLNLEKERQVFDKTFETIHRTLGPDAFHRYDSLKEKFLGGFLLSAFEVVALGMGFHGGELGVHDSEIIDRIKSIWVNPRFQKSSGSGVRASSRVPNLIPLGREIFKP